MRHIQALTLISLLATAAMPQAAMAEHHQKAEKHMKIEYPVTKTGDVVEPQFGVNVADPYRWLEKDVREDDDVKAWVKAQQKVTNAYMKTVPGRDVLAKRMTELFNYERFGVPVKKGEYYFYTRNDGLQNQSVLYVKKGKDGEPRVLIDPNKWAADGANALASWVPSGDGSKLVYAIQDGGSDWRTIKVLDVATGKVLDDTVEWAKFTGMSWVQGSAGFTYARFPKPKDGEAFQSLNKNHQIYYHTVGTDQSKDHLLYSSPDEPDLNHFAEITDDKRFALVTSSSGTDDRYRLTLLNLLQDTPTAHVLVKELKYDWRLVGIVNDDLYFVTNKNAPRLRVVKMKVDGGEDALTEVVAESAATIDGASIVGGKLVINYMDDAKNKVSLFDLAGKPTGTLALPGIGSVNGFSGSPDETDAFFSFSSFNRPSTIYSYDSKSGDLDIWAKPKLAFNPDDFQVEQRFYPSKDGTKIPMFIVHKKGLDLSKGAPTILYGYGGFNISLTPGFSVTRLTWMDKGGVFVMANLRGGGEYGKAWHDGGRLQNKQNVFDDFIAAGEYLIESGITGKGQLAIEGRSNGGLLVGAVANQRPDLFAAGHAAVGVMDMLRFDRFTAGRYWVDDYGYPNKEADFKTQLSYSPYHNIKSGVDYPALMITTADTDDRVVPGHSFKYTARLQAADAGDKPHLIRIETRAGHGSGKPTDKVIEEFSDVYGFLAKWTGLELK